MIAHTTVQYSDSQEYMACVEQVCVSVDKKKVVCLLFV